MPFWRLMVDPPQDAPVNMATDEALLDCANSGSYAATLRFYSWKAPTLSVGRFQKIRDTLLRVSADRLRLEIVRRPTGGMAVLHHREITYSLAASAPYCAEAALHGPIKHSYRRIGQALVAGLRRLGIPVELLEPPCDAERRVSPSCFAVPSGYEVGVGGKKLIGSAQVRRNGCLLQHGSILLGLDAGLHEILFSAAEISGVATLESLIGAGFSPCSIIESLAFGFEEFFHVELKPGNVSSEEAERARNLTREKHDDDEWIFSR